MAPLDDVTYETLYRLVSLYAPDAKSRCETISRRLSTTPRGSFSHESFADVCTQLSDKVSLGVRPYTSSRFNRLVSRFKEKNVLRRRTEMLQFLSAVSRLKTSKASFIESYQPDELVNSQLHLDLGLDRTRETDSIDNEQRTLVEERGTLHQVAFILQGLSSEDVTFDKEMVAINNKLPKPVVLQISRLCEAGLLFKGLTQFCNQEDGKDSLIKQSLRSHFNEQLKGYLSVVAAIENETRAADLAGEQRNHASLKCCILWISDYQLKLRLMFSIIESIKGLLALLLKNVNVEGEHGGRALDIIHKAAMNGDPAVKSFIEDALRIATQPFYEMLSSWVYFGELNDPYKEFFVVEHSVEDSKESIWDRKYEWSRQMLPSFFDTDLANKIFLIGKNLNFLRHACEEDSWVTEYSNKHAKQLSHGNISALNSDIEDAYQSTVDHVKEVMIERYHLMDHLIAIKKYLLLGQGDFVALLMDTISPSLDQPANSLFRHSLASALESVVRDSNANFDPPHVRDSLDARMLELSHGEVGWDVFTLEYKVESPMNVIITPHCSRQYLKVFNFLWRLKRVEYALTAAWRSSIQSERSVLRWCSEEGKTAWKKAYRLLQEMTHFIRQLQYYILFEVIENSWGGLIYALSSKDCTLDTLITAHHRYVQNITEKGLLAAVRRGGGSLLSQLHEIIKIMLNFTDVTHVMYDNSVLELSQRATMKLKSTINGARDGVLLTENGFFDDLRNQVADAELAFKKNVGALLVDLAHQPDPEMKFLGVRLNMNEFYGLQRHHSKK